ncbi:MAG: ScnB-like protein [Pseudomonadota bacterium]
MSAPTPTTNFRDTDDGRAVHDLGGLAFGPIDKSEHDLALWEKRTDAMLALLFAQAFSVDAMRRTIETYAQQEYEATSYYEKWVKALRNLVVEQGLMTREEVDARFADVRARLRDAGQDVDDGEVSW